MKFFITGVGGQLGHDVMNELAKRGYTGVGTDLAESYSGIQDGSYVTTAEYVSLDITNSEAVMNTIKAVRDEIKSRVTADIPASASLNAVATVAQKKTTKEAIITAFFCLLISFCLIKQMVCLL